MMRLLLLLQGLCCFLCLEVSALICNDISTQACTLLEASKPDMCNDTTISTTTCPRYCSKCALECYHCDQAVANVTDCNSTKACNDGEVCMFKELKSTADSHQEYIMTCEAKTHCDGLGLTFPFVGRRSIEERDISVRCCDTDLCNYHSNTVPTSTMPTTMTGCMKDVLILVDESSSMIRYQNDIVNFIASLVGDLGVSSQGTHVSMTTYAGAAHERFDLNDHVSLSELQQAIKNVHFKGGNDNLAFGLSYVVQQATSPVKGDRQHVPDVLLLVTDHTASSYIVRLYERSLHARIKDVIAVGISSHASTQELQLIATDSGHVVRVRDSSGLTQHQTDIAKLICN